MHLARFSRASKRAFEPPAVDPAASDEVELVAAPPEPHAATAAPITSADSATAAARDERLSLRSMSLERFRLSFEVGAPGESPARDVGFSARPVSSA